MRTLVGIFGILCITAAILEFLGLLDVPSHNFFNYFYSFIFGSIGILAIWLAFVGDFRRNSSSGG